MKPRTTFLLWCVVAVWTGAVSCTASPTTPTIFSVAGEWSGSGSNQLGNHGISLTLTQVGATVTGHVVTRAVDPVGTTCASCHMQKTGTVTGQISGQIVSLVMAFPTGGAADPTPHCATTITLSVPTTTPTQIAGAYEGHDTCEGAFVNATLMMTRR